jgi:sulfur carrier protein ThiS adenylyltransferase
VADAPTCFLPLEPDDDPALRARLAASHVAIIGCGGLGSNAAMMLVRCGVGELTLIDFDAVEESNLNRQMYFRDQLGMAKTEALRDNLLRITPDAVLHVHQECISPENLAEFVAGADVVIEAVDRAEIKAMIVNTALEQLPGTPLVSASGLAGLDSANDIVTEQIADGFYMVGDQRSDVRTEHSLFASRVMTAAAHEAHIVVRILLGYPEP